MRVGPRIAVGALLMVAYAMPHPVAARERVFHCATSPVLAPVAATGHGVRTNGGRRFYAPVRSAMFFSRAGSGCRWKVPRRHRG